MYLYVAGMVDVFNCSCRGFFNVVIVVFAVAVQLVVRPWCARARARDTGKCVLETTKLLRHWFYIVVKIKTHDQQI